MMNNFNPCRQEESLKRRWPETLTAMESNHKKLPTSSTFYTKLFPATPSSSTEGFPVLDDDLASAAIPSVTVVLEGRSICHRVNLHKHSSYQSLAKALREMFVDGGDAGGATCSENELDLSNAIPGHVIAYEDTENDLLLAGDLNWKDFVRVAKRIRILPVKAKSKKGREGS